MSRTVLARPTPGRPSRAERQVARAAAAAGRRYLGVGGVVAVGPGLRREGGAPTEALCVQLHVRRGARRHALPRFVYGRRADGSVDHGVKHPTDVVETGELELACGAGSPLRAATGREGGTATLLFRNRAEAGEDAWCLLTCAHVAGELEDSPPDRPELASPACAEADPFARVVKSALPERRALAYDIALARLSPGARAELGPARLAGLDGRVAGEGIVLTGFLAPERIRPGLDVEVRAAGSGDDAGTVLSGPNASLVELDGRRLRMGDVYETDVAAEAGDSGGIVYRDDEAVGILFARSRSGRGWFQPLESAVRWLARRRPRGRLRPFGGPRARRTP